MSFDAAAIARRIKAVLPPSNRPVALHEPVLGEAEKRRLAECIDSGWVSYGGPAVAAFEGEIARVCGTRHAVAVVNGTVAVEMALRLAGVQPGDEVFCPDLTFVGTANAIVHVGAVPHFIDSERASLGLSPAALAARLAEVAVRRPQGPINRETGRLISAVMPMHTFGHPVDMDGVNRVAADWGLAVVEDAAEAFGSLYGGRPCGSLARIGAVSFNGNKVVTTGGGGAIVTDDDALAARARHLTTTAKLPHPYLFLHDEVGYNYRLPALNAALGLAQMEQYDGFLAAKRRLAERYATLFAGDPDVEFVAEPAGSRSLYWLCAVLVPDRAAREALLAATHAEGLLTRPAWTLMHRLAMFADCPRGAVPVAEMLEDRLVCLPSSATLA